MRFPGLRGTLNNIAFGSFEARTHPASPEHLETRPVVQGVPAFRFPTWGSSALSGSGGNPGPCAARLHQRSRQKRFYASNLCATEHADAEDRREREFRRPRLERLYCRMGEIPAKTGSCRKMVDNELGIDLLDLFHWYARGCLQGPRAIAVKEEVLACCRGRLLRDRRLMAYRKRPCQ